MAEQTRNQSNQQNRDQHGSQRSEGAARRDKDTETRQTRSDRPSEAWREDDQQKTDSSERERSHREPSSIANDRGRDADPERRSFSDDREADRLGSELDDESLMDDEDVDERGRNDR